MKEVQTLPREILHGDSWIEVGFNWMNFQCPECRGCIRSHPARQDKVAQNANAPDKQSSNVKAICRRNHFTSLVELRTSSPTTFSVASSAGICCLSASRVRSILRSKSSIPVRSDCFAPSFNFNPFNVYVTPFERFNIFAKANYDVSDTVSVYTRGLFSKNTRPT